jgi:hypothetical protein
VHFTGKTGMSIIVATVKYKVQKLGQSSVQDQYRFVCAYMVQGNWFSLHQLHFHNKPPGTFLSAAMGMNTVWKYHVKSDVNYNTLAALNSTE